MTRLAEFNHSSLEPGSKEVHKLQLFEVAGQMRDINVFTVKGRKFGPVFFAAAGVHGDEYEGIFAIQQFFKELDPDVLAGTFIGIPVCNILAFENMSRESPTIVDGLNLAREFPGAPNGSYTKRLANELMSFVRRNLNKETDLMIDFHSSGSRYEYVPLIGGHSFSSCFEREKEMSRVSGIKNLWDFNKNKKSFNGAVSAEGITCLGAEMTGRGGAEPEDIELYVRVLRSLCGRLGLTNDKYVDCKKNLNLVHTQMFENDGLFLSPLKLGCRLRKGDVIGKIVDICGNTIQTVTAECDGVLVGIRKQSAAYAGEVSYLIEKVPQGEGN